MTDTTGFPASGGGGGSRKLLLAAVAAVLSTALLRRQDLRVDPGLSCAQRNGRSPRVVGVYLLFVLAVACRWESGQVGWLPLPTNLVAICCHDPSTFGVGAMGCESSAKNARAAWPYSP